MEDKNLAVVSICAKLASLHTYEYTINNNVNNKHYTGKEELYKLISPFFDNQSKYLQKIHSMIKENQSFEIDTKNQKIYKLENDKKEEMKNLRRKALKKHFSLEDFHKQKMEKRKPS